MCVSTILCVESHAWGMATGRDRVWAAALEVGLEQDEFRVDDVLAQLGDDAPSRKTIQRTLRGMKETGVVTHAPGSPWYSCRWTSTSGDGDAGADESGPAVDVDALVDHLRVWLADRPPQKMHAKQAVADVFRRLAEAGGDPVETSELRGVVYEGREQKWGNDRAAWNSVNRYLGDVPGVESSGAGEWWVDVDAARELTN